MSISKKSIQKVEAEERKDDAIDDMINLKGGLPWYVDIGQNLFSQLMKHANEQHYNSKAIEYHKSDLAVLQSDLDSIRTKTGLLASNSTSSKVEEAGRLIRASISSLQELIRVIEELHERKHRWRSDRRN